MDASLSVPSATSYRTIPVKLLEENRRIINEHQKEHNLNRVSFTHIIAWALVRALREFPVLNSSYELVDGAPHRRMKTAVNLGVAVDLERKDGSHTLLVPNIKDAEEALFPRVRSGLRLRRSRRCAREQSIRPTSRARRSP